MNIEEVADLISDIKQDIEDDYRAFDDDEVPGIQLTIASTDGKDWGWQTGANCYSGGAYGYAFWAVEGVYRDTNCRELATEMVREVEEQIAEDEYWEGEGP